LSVDLQRFSGMASKAGTSVPVTLVEAQVPAVTVPPTKQPALEPLHEVKWSFYTQAVGAGVPYAAFHASAPATIAGVPVVVNEQGRVSPLITPVIVIVCYLRFMIAGASLFESKYW
jgi:hypothetical protein